MGGLNTIFGYSVYALLIVLNLHYVLAATLSQIAGILFNFQTTGRIVFENPDQRLIFRFFGAYGITYLLNLALLTVLKNFGINMLFAGVIVVLPMAIVSFFLFRKFVFKTTRQGRE